MNLHLCFRKHRVVPFLFITFCCAMIFCASYFLCTPASEAKPLEVLMLNQETEPVFYLTSQVTYDTNQLHTYLSDLSIENNTASTELNLIISLESNQVDYLKLTKDLAGLAAYCPDMSLSVLPGSAMTNDTYLMQFEVLSQMLHQNNLSSVTLIAYPPDATNLQLYNTDSVTHIGTVLKNLSDLELLKKVYETFSSSKHLVVRDEIKNFYGSEIMAAAKDITGVYYQLAVNYPAVETIFSPYITAPLQSQDNYALNTSDADFYTFSVVYNRLLNRPWLTQDSQPVSNISPYGKIAMGHLLSDEVELILVPDTAVTNLITESSNHPVYFKWNTSLLDINMCYPYSIIIDTLKVPNGISRLSVSIDTGIKTGYDTYSIDLAIENTTLLTRSQRVPSVSTRSASVVKPTKTYIPTLMYHTIEDTVLPENQNSHVSTVNFEAQMKALIDNGYTPINFLDLKNYVAGTVTLPDKPILITMDDGYTNNYTNAYPIYKKYNIQATLFVSPYYMTEENTERHFGWQAAKEMEESGLIDIQSHGYNHTPFTYLSVRDMKYHASFSRGLIESHLGPRDVSVLAYPQFRHNKQSISVLNELGYDFQMINVVDPEKIGTVLYKMPTFSPPLIKRLNVPNTMSPEELITILDKLTI